MEGEPEEARGPEALERAALDILRQAPALISIHRGPEHTVVFTNDYFDEQVERQVLGLALRRALPELEDSVIDYFDRAYRTGETLVVHELAARGEDVAVHGERYFKLILRPWRDGSGAIQGVISCGFEITQLIQQRRSLRLAERERETVISILGHDLRNPISLIKVVVSHLLRSDQLPPSFAKPMTRVLRATERMSRLIDDILDLARGRFGFQMHLDPIPSDMGELCTRVAAEQDALTTKAISVRCEGDMHGCWDRERVSQAIANVVGNAVQHGAGAVAVLAEGAGQEVRVHVHNPGNPIPPDRLPRIFEPFAKAAEGTEQRTSGLGLGLYITREILHAHGGEIDVRSNAEEGTTFTLRWPRQPTTRTA